MHKNDFGCLKLHIPMKKMRLEKIVPIVVLEKPEDIPWDLPQQCTALSTHFAGDEPCKPVLLKCTACPHDFLALVSDEAST